MTDIAELHAEALDATGMIVAGIPADRWHAGTPCDGWDARHDHAGGVQRLSVQFSDVGHDALPLHMSRRSAAAPLR